MKVVSKVLFELKKTNMVLPENLVGIEHHVQKIKRLVKGRRKVEAICVGAYKHCFTDEKFRNLPDLRVLRIDYAELVGDSKGLLPNLRWLQWCNCPRNSTPTNFHLANLVILDLSDSCDLKDDWEGWSQIKMAKKLKVLNLSGCNGLTRIPNFSTFTALEILDLRNSQYLKDDLEDWSQIKMAKKLKVLNLSRCNGLTRTPDFSTFTALEILIIGMCEKLAEFHPSIWKLKNLRVLDISTDGHASPAIAITKFPDEIGNLEKLEEINASNCWHLQGEIPSSVGSLSSLRILRLDNTKICSLPTSICRLSRLKELQLLDCGNLQCILVLPPSLFKILVKNCQSLERLPDLSNLKNLSYITLHNLDKLREIPELGELEYLDIAHCQSLERLPDLSNLSYVTLHNLDKLREIPKLGESEYLDIAPCQSLKRLPDLSNLKELQRIDIVECKNLIEIQGFGKLELFTSLKISDCKSLERLPDVSNLGMLKYLSLYGCEKLVEIEGLGGLKSLEILDVPFTSLKRLDLSSLKNLKELKILHCKNLKELKILHCKNLSEIQGLEELESLGFLNMAGCKLIEKLPDLSNLKKLKILIAFSCEKLTEIRGLEDLKSLKLLDISGCKSIERLPDLLNTRIDTNSSRAKKWEAEGWNGYEHHEWNGWELEEWEIPCSPSSSLKASKSEQEVKNACDEGNTSADTAFSVKMGYRELWVAVGVAVCVLLGLKASKSDGHASPAIAITKFPDEIGNLEKLEEINALNCWHLQGKIPSSIGRLSSLRILRLSYAKIYSLPTSICGLSRLETLDLFNCHKLQSLPDELPSSLTSLRVTCQSMETFPGCLSNLINLKNLVFSHCVNLVEITRDIGKLSQLETLTLESCHKLRTLPAEIGAISLPKKLELRNCINLQCILALPPSLFKIQVVGCPSLEGLPDLSN
ncbi:disease resistance protein RPV1-like [Fagus crenata]